MLRDLGPKPLTIPFPGFTGAIYEQLVSKGLATRQAAGNMPPPDFIKTKEQLRHFRSDPHPQFTYAITEAGRAHLQSQQEAA